MAQTIKLRRSAVQGSVPTTTQLALGELAINTYDGKLFLKKDVSGTETVVEVGAGSGASLSANNAFTGANTFTNTTGQIFRQTATQDGILLRGRLGGTSSFSVELVPTTLTASRTLTLPDINGTVVTTGDTGSVTGTMIAANTIVDGDIATNAAIAGTKISPNFGAQLIQSSANPGLSLTGSVTGATTTQGVLAQGSLGFSGARVGANFADTQTQYYQVILQNKSSSTNASCDFVVCNDSSTDSTTYGNLGINSSTYSGTGVFNQPNSVYLTSNGGPLGIGTITAHDIRFSYNGEATDSLTLGATAATFGKTVLLKTGTATDAPLDFNGGTLLTTPVAGAVEYDGTFYYSTPTTTSGRGQIPSLQTFRLTANGALIGPAIADFYGANSSINLAANSVYEIKFFAYFQKNSAGTLTWTLAASSAPTLISGILRAGPVTGIAAGAPTTLYTGSRNATTAAFGATGSITNNAFMAYEFQVQVITNLATNFRLRVTSSAGTVGPQAGSFYTVSQISSTTGSFAA